MANNRLELKGMDELRAALRSLPTDLARDAAVFVEDATEHSASSLIQSYPLGDTGNLRAGVKWSVAHDAVSTVGTVKSTSPNAHLWEFGTAVRKTRQGWNRGISPEHHRDGLVPIAIRNRKTMNTKMLGVVRDAGFIVTGVF